MAMPRDLCGDGALRRMWPNFKPYHKAGWSRNTANANQTSTHVTNQSNTPLGGKKSRQNLYIRGLYTLLAAIAFRESLLSGEGE
jgi:hypothetical protein